MSDLPVNEPNEELDPVTEEMSEQEQTDMAPETSISPPETIDDSSVKANASRRWLGIAVVVVLLLIILAGAGWLINTRNQERAQWQQAQIAVQEGAWSLAEQYLDEQLALQPAFAQQLTAEALGLHGIARYQQGHVEGALVDMNEALALDGELMDVLAYRALALSDSDLGAAQADAQTAVSSGLLSPYLEAQMQYLLAGGDEAESLIASGYLTDAQVAELALAQAAQAAEAEAWQDVVAATTAVLDREYELEPAQTAQLAYAAAVAHQQLGEMDAVFVYAKQALAQDAGLTETEQAALHAFQAVWYEGHSELETAMSEAEMAATLNETFVLHQALQAWQAYKTFDMETAVSAAEAVLETADPDSLAAQIANRTLGGVYTMQDNPSEALPFLNQALAINPEDVETRALRMVNLVRDSQWDLVEGDLDVLTETAPDVPVSLWAQAFVALSTGDLELANVLLDQAIAQDDTRPEYYAFRAESYRTTLDEEMADEDLAKALSLYPESLFALESQQYRLSDNFEFDQLEETAQKLIELYPESPSGYLMLIYHHLDVTGDYDEALRQAEEAITRNPYAADSYRLRALIHLLMDDLESAQEDYEQVLELDPEDIDGLMGLAAVAYVNDDYETAVAYAEEALDLNPRGLSLRSELVSYHLDQEKLEKAWELIHQVLAEDSRFSTAMRLKAYMFASAGEIDKAVGEIEKLINLSPNDPFAHSTKASFLLQVGRIDEAIESAEQAIALDPFSAYPHRILFSAALTNNDLDEANAQLDLWQEKASVFDEDVELLSNMLLSSGRFDEVIETTTDALVEETDVAMHYFNRGLAYLNQNEVESGQADFEQVLMLAEDINLIADVEEVLADSKQVVFVDNGRLQYTNDTFGYTLNYADFWEKRAVNGVQTDLMLVYETDEEFGAAYTVIFQEELDLTAEMVADFVISENSSNPAFTLLSSVPTDFESNDSYVIRYELDVGELFQGKQYVFVEGERFILLSLEAYDDSFADLEEEFDIIATSFEFLP